jgi:hypothetical protein
MPTDDSTGRHEVTHPLTTPDRPFMGAAPDASLESEAFHSLAAGMRTSLGIGCRRCARAKRVRVSEGARSGRDQLSCATQVGCQPGKGILSLTTPLAA